MSRVKIQADFIDKRDLAFLDKKFPLFKERRIVVAVLFLRIGQ